jgi:hypothetical protein
MYVCVCVCVCVFVRASHQISSVSLMSTGVALGFIAIVVMSLAHARKDREAAAAEAASGGIGAKWGVVIAEQPDNEETLLLVNKTGSGKKKTKSNADGENRSTSLKLLICVVSGLLMSLWSPLAAYSRDKSKPGYLSTYSSFLFYTAAVFVTTPVLLALQNRRWLLPRVGPRVRLSAYLCIPCGQHIWGLLGGFVWSVGTLSNLLSGDKIGYVAPLWLVPVIHLATEPAVRSHSEAHCVLKASHTHTHACVNVLKRACDKIAHVGTHVRMYATHVSTAKLVCANHSPPPLPHAHTHTHPRTHTHVHAHALTHTLTQTHTHACQVRNRVRDWAECSDGGHTVGSSVLP